MRKLRIIIATVVGLLALSAVAFAAQVNTYTVTASVFPTKTGTKSKPVPVGLNFSYTVGEKSGQRPGLINKYDINFGGAQVNTDVPKSCPAAKINAAIAQGQEPGVFCPKGSEVGAGNVENQAGATNDPTSKPDSFKCHLDLTLYNGQKNHAAIYLHGAPNPADPAKNCALNVDQAIDATYVKKSGGVSLVFSVNETLLHPVPGVDNSVVLTHSTIKKITKKIKGKTRGYYESVGGCKSGKRTIKVTFTQVDGSSQNVTNTAKCSK